MIRFLLIPFFFAFFFNIHVESVDDDYVYQQLGWVNDTNELELPAVAKYTRVTEAGANHVYRVCNGKNKKTCGYWENVKTKKKVASGVTTYNKKKGLLIIKKFRKTDCGVYTGGKKKIQVALYFTLGGSGGLGKR